MVPLGVDAQLVPCEPVQPGLELGDEEPQWKVSVAMTTQPTKVIPRRPAELFPRCSDPPAMAAVPTPLRRTSAARHRALPSPRHHGHAGRYVRLYVEAIPCKHLDTDRRPIKRHLRKRSRNTSAPDRLRSAGTRSLVEERRTPDRGPRTRWLHTN